MGIEQFCLLRHLLTHGRADQPPMWVYMITNVSYLVTVMSGNRSTLLSSLVLGVFGTWVQILDLGEILPFYF